MELTKNIFFNTDKLIENSKIKISYTGKFFQDSSEEVFIHYGFGYNWDSINDIKMEKTELGFQAEIFLGESETFNFCFKNNNNEWDNNNNHNYIFLIEHPEASLVLLEDFDVPTIRRLRKSYIISKKVKLAIYKMLIYVPRLISGNYKKKRKADTNV